MNRMGWMAGAASWISGKAVWALAAITGTAIADKTLNLGIGAGVKDVATSIGQGGAEVKELAEARAAQLDAEFKSRSGIIGLASFVSSLLKMVGLGSIAKNLDEGFIRNEEKYLKQETSRINGEVEDAQSENSQKVVSKITPWLISAGVAAGAVIGIPKAIKAYTGRFDREALKNEAELKALKAKDELDAYKKADPKNPSALDGSNGPKGGNNAEFDAAKRNGQGDLFEGNTKGSITATKEATEEMVEKAGKGLFRGHGRSLLIGTLVGGAMLGWATIANASETPNANGNTPADPNAAAEKTAMAVGTGIGAAVTSVEMAKGASMFLREGAEFGLKRVPLIGGIVTLGFSGFAAAGMALNGQGGAALAELGTGVVEAAVNTTGLGLIGGGDLAREAVRGVVVATAGEDFAPEKSGLRSIFETVTQSGPTEVATAPQTYNQNQFSAAVTADPQVQQVAGLEEPAMSTPTTFPDMFAAAAAYGSASPMAPYNPNKGATMDTGAAANKRRKGLEYNAA